MLPYISHSTNTPITYTQQSTGNAKEEVHMKANMLNVHLKYDKQFLILPFYMTHLFTLQKSVDF